MAFNEAEAPSFAKGGRGNLKKDSIQKMKRRRGMINLIKKIVFTGVGLASLTKDKIESLGKEIADQAKMSEKEGKELLDELMKKSEESRKELENQVEKFVKASLKKTNLVTQDDLQKLEKTVQQLSSALKDRDEKE